MQEIELLAPCPQKRCGVTHFSAEPKVATASTAKLLPKARAGSKKRSWAFFLTAWARPEEAWAILAATKGPMSNK